jgi:glycosyltransferase involved in cell wall biosynthesis
MSATFYVKHAGFKGALQSHVLIFFKQPLRYLRSLVFALRLGRFDLKKILYNFFYFVEAVMVGNWMQKNHFTHLHVHFGSTGATVGLITKHCFPITFSLTIHGPDEFYDVPGHFLSQKIKIADFICCISHFARSQLMMLSVPSDWHKLEISRLGVDSSIFKPVVFRENPQPFEILCVGRLVPVKGQFILLDAVAHLLTQGRQIRLRFVGDGPDRLGLQQTVKEKHLTEYVIFEGAVNQDKILKLYKQSDVFALASFAEGLPVVLMEAMAMQIPCVTTHITGVPELIKVGEGLLVAPSDVEGLTAAFTRLMDNPQLRCQIGEAGRQRVLHDYELKTNTRKLAEIFYKRIGNHSHDSGNSESLEKE